MSEVAGESHVKIVETSDELTVTVRKVGLGSGYAHVVRNAAEQAHENDVETVTPDRVPGGYLAAARSAGAHDEYIAFVAEYPDSEFAKGLERAISMDKLDEFEGFAGSLEFALFDRGVSGVGLNVDQENERRMRTLFDESQLPEWMQGSGDGDA